MCTFKSSLSENGFDIDRHEPSQIHQPKTMQKHDEKLMVHWDHRSSCSILGLAPGYFWANPLVKTHQIFRVRLRTPALHKNGKQSGRTEQGNDCCGCTTDVPTNVCSTVDFWRKMVKQWCEKTNHWLPWKPRSFQHVPEILIEVRKKDVSDHSSIIFTWGCPDVPADLKKFAIWLPNMAMENPQNKWRFLAGNMIYFYGPWLPWQTVSHKQRGNRVWWCFRCPKRVAHPLRHSNHSPLRLTMGIHRSKLCNWRWDQPEFSISGWRLTIHQRESRTRRFCVCCRRCRFQWPFHHWTLDNFDPLGLLGP